MHEACLYELLQLVSVKLKEELICEFSPCVHGDLLLAPNQAEKPSLFNLPLFGEVFCPEDENGRYIAQNRAVLRNAQGLLKDIREGGVLSCFTSGS